MILIINTLHIATIHYDSQKGTSLNQKHFLFKKKKNLEIQKFSPSGYLNTFTLNKRFLISLKFHNIMCKKSKEISKENSPNCFWYNSNDTFRRVKHGILRNFVILKKFEKSKMEIKLFPANKTFFCPSHSCFFFNDYSDNQ